ncbi:MAG: hypothetical protein LAT82_00850 [Nanoarchaeota archaeon]|nr:hypothetical protein [Nanoarchaeota archaeon]
MVEKVKTGTTCIGLLCKDGVILAADRRTTAGFIASDAATKVYELSSNIVATTAGHAADNQRVMRAMQGELKLSKLKNERESYVIEAAMLINSTQYSMLRQMGSIVSVILGGFDSSKGAQLFNLSPDGTILPHDGYVVDGSGSAYVKGVLDTFYKPNMSVKEAQELVERGFLASFKNDNMSGGGYIAKVITKSGIKEIARKSIENRFVDVDF